MNKQKKFFVEWKFVIEILKLELDFNCIFEFILNDFEFYFSLIYKKEKFII